MTYELPSGIPATVCRLGGAAGPRVDVPDGAVIDVRLYIDRPIVHTATRVRFSPSRRGQPIPVSAPGEGIEFSVPPVDADGFIDAATGEAVTDWSYRIAGVFRWDDHADGQPRTQRIDKTFQPTGDLEFLNLNDVPDNAEALPAVLVPRPAVSSVAGLNGAVGAADLADALLADFAPAFDPAGSAASAQSAAIAAAATDATNKVAAEATARAAAITSAINALVASAPGVLDTLDELAAALGDDPNFATTVLAALAGKQPNDATLTALSGLATTAFGRALLALADGSSLAAILRDVSAIPAVRFCVTSNLNLALPGSGPFDGVTANLGDLFLARAQSVTSQNGVYVYNGPTTPATRAPGYDTAAKVAGATVRVLEGTSQGGLLRRTNFKATDTLDTTTQQWYVAWDSSNTIPTAQGGTGGTDSPSNGQTLIAASGAYRARNFQPTAWAPSTAVIAYQTYVLPTGGLGYVTANRTTGASWDATERAAWTFIPGNHEETLTSSGTWTCPTGITQITELELIGAGAGGNGAGSCSSAIAQVGGAGGAAGERVWFKGIPVVAGTGYSYAIPVGGAGGAGGAAGGNPGSQGNSGSSATFTVGSTTYTARGGYRGGVQAANSTLTVTAGWPGQSWANTVMGPGQGGIPSTGNGQPTIPLNGLYGGGAGGPATTAPVGGLGGDALTSISQSLIASRTPGGSGSTSGTAGTTATVPGCGGGGGGAGANGGAGGAGGSGGRGEITVQF